MTEHEPLESVRKSFRVKWYRCPIEKDQLKALTERSDAWGFFFAMANLMCVALTGAATVWLLTSGAWIAGILMLFVHGTIFSFISGLATHELSHGTVFKTKGLNQFFLRIYSVLGWVNFHHYKRSHTFHHQYTLHPKGDREVVLPANPDLSLRRMLMVFTFNWEACRFVAGKILRLAFMEDFDDEWSQALYPPEAIEQRRKAIRWARVVVAFHTVVLAVALVSGLWPLPLVISLAPWIANWWSYFIGMTMHTGLVDNVPDFRLCCRTIKLDPFSRLLYWNMNYHTEHHMYAAVPCYKLPLLHAALADDMPKSRSLLEAWKEMRMTWKRQQEEPEYQYRTPLPESAAPANTSEEAGSLGDLAPDELAKA